MWGNILTHIGVHHTSSEFLQATLIKKAEEEVRITVAHTVERQLALANAKGHGCCFHVTHGCHMSHDDFFVLSELLAHHEQRATLSRKKKRCCPTSMHRGKVA
jgi:hypothetical protein